MLYIDVVKTGQTKEGVLGSGDEERLDKWGYIPAGF